MSSDVGRVPWPYTISGDRLLEEQLGGDGPSAGITVGVVLTAAEAFDVDPTDLPTLNDRVDPDAIDELVVDADPPDGVRLGVAVSFPDGTVIVGDDGRMSVVGTDLDAAPLEGHLFQHDWVSPEPLSTSLADAIATVTDREAEQVYEQLSTAFDVDALDRVLKPRGDGSLREGGRMVLSIDGYEVTVDAGGRIGIESTLAPLKRAGSTILVVGDVPERIVERASATLLGDPAVNRRALFGFYGRNASSADRRLEIAGFPAEQSVVLDGGEATRSATAATQRPLDTGPPVERIGDDFESLCDAMTDRIASFDDGVDAADVRVCVDTIEPVVAGDGPDDVVDVLEPFCAAVRDASAITHVVLQRASDDRAVRSLEPLFDAVIELRPGNGSPEQRWRLPETGYDTGWFALGR